LKRILLLLAMASIMLSLVGTQAFAKPADLPPPGEETPGNPQSPDENPIPETKQVGDNCYGAGQRDFLGGPGGNPGSAAQPTPEFDSFNGPFTSQFAQSDQEAGGGNPLSQFQQDYREATASCGDTGAP
jgi:hypothetical protein